MRWNAKHCRLCAKSSQNINIIPLFERSRKGTLRRFFQLTGIKLKNLSDTPTVMCANCEIELNRACEFRERCITAQTFFSSAEYKILIDQTHKENRNIRNKTEDVESAGLKTEGMYVNEYEIVETESARNLKNDPKAVAEVENEFVALNEAENLHAIYDDCETELLDQSMGYTIRELTQRDKSKDEIEKELENPIEETEKGEDVMLIPKEKEVKSEPEENDLIEAYNQKKSRNNSKRKHNKEYANKARIYICEQCGNNFKNRSHFLSHIKRHTGIKPLQCEVCPNKFFTEGELKRHMRRHTGERPFPCQHCSRRFADYSTRTKHERTHTNERPFECTQCGKAFTTSYVLKNHMLVHTGERSFKCEVCNKSFQRQTHLITHARSLAHKQNVEREQQKLVQQKSDKIRCLPSQIPSTDT